MAMGCFTISFDRDTTRPFNDSVYIVAIAELLKNNQSYVGYERQFTAYSIAERKYRPVGAT